MIELISAIVPVIGKVLDKFVEDKDKKAEIEKEIQLELFNNQYKLEQLKAEIVKEEVKGKSWLQRNWRPLLMLNFVLIIFNNYILFPYLSIFTDKVKVLDFPPEFWNLLLIGVGGYIAGRTFEKIKGVAQ